LGCELFEVHFSIEKVISPDMVVSLLPYSLSIYGREILRAVEILGNSWKHPILEEISEQYWIRRGSDGLRPKEE